MKGVHMTFNDAIKYFGSRNEMMEQLEVSKQVVSNWSKQPDKPLPKVRQWQIGVIQKFMK
jgi:hypothetical protein